jgi:hypothetical protein
MVAIITTIYHHNDHHHESNWIRLYCLFVLPSQALDPIPFTITVNRLYFCFRVVPQSTRVTTLASPNSPDHMRVFGSFQ